MSLKSTEQILQDFPELLNLEKLQEKKITCYEKLHLFITQLIPHLDELKWFHKQLYIQVMSKSFSISLNTQFASNPITNLLLKLLVEIFKAAKLEIFKNATNVDTTNVDTTFVDTTFEYQKYEYQKYECDKFYPLFKKINNLITSRHIKEFILKFPLLDQIIKKILLLTNLDTYFPHTIHKSQPKMKIESLNKSIIYLEMESPPYIYKTKHITALTDHNYLLICNTRRKSHGFSKENFIHHILSIMETGIGIKLYTEANQFDNQFDSKNQSKINYNKIKIQIKACAMSNCTNMVNLRFHTICNLMKNNKIYNKCFLHVNILWPFGSVLMHY